MTVGRNGESRLKRMGLSKIVLVGALVTITTSANAVMPLIAQQELTEILGGINNYQLFLEAVTLIAAPFLLISPLILKGWTNKRVCQAGMAVIGIINFTLFMTNLEWHPLILRCMIGIGYGLTLPMGQFLMSGTELSEEERVTQFTMMLNLIALGLSIVPFIAISIMWGSGGESKFIFLFLSIAAWSVAIASEWMIGDKNKIYSYRLHSIKLGSDQLKIAIGDIIVIGVTRSTYALVLVWLSEIIHSFAQLQVISLFFTIPFVLWGFVAIPWVKKLGTNQSYLLFCVIPLIALSAGITSGTSHILPVLLIIVALLSIPEAFTPGQLVSQWTSAAGRQFGNLVSMMLMTVCLSVGPMVLHLANSLTQQLNINNYDLSHQRAILLLAIALPIYLIPMQYYWKKYVAIQLKQ